MADSLKVAIIGGGFAGLSIASRLAKRVPKIHIFDKYDRPGVGGASAAAAGLLHPFSSQQSIIYKGIESFSSSLDMMKEISKDVGIDVFLAQNQPVIRPIVNEKELPKWVTCANNHPELLQFYSKECTVSKSALVTPEAVGSVIFKSAFAVDSVKYLEAMWKYVHKHNSNAKWIQASIAEQEIQSMETDFDVIILACGSGIAPIWPYINSRLNINRSFPVSFVRGQSLLYAIKKEAISGQLKDISKYSLLLGEYVVPCGNRDIWNGDHLEQNKVSDKEYTIIGSTHTRISLDTVLKDESKEGNGGTEQEVDLTEDTLRSRITRLSPLIAEEVMNQNGNQNSNITRKMRQGVRVLTNRCNRGRLPIIDHVGGRYWTFTGLGSRGLLYHGILSEMLASSILKGFGSTNPGSDISDEWRLWRKKTSIG